MKPGAQVFQVVDVERVDANDPSAAIKTFVSEGKPKIVECDVLIAGGGMGGIAAAIRARQKGLLVCVTEETEWIGGQVSSQGVSALDENKYVEESGATRMYQKWRKLIRDYYGGKVNPGECWVSRLSFEPPIGMVKLQQLMSEETNKKPPHIYSRTKVVAAKVYRGRVKSALAVNLDSGKFIEFRTRFLIDATELGDMLPLLDIPYSSGAESREETGEPHAPEQANPDNVQDFTYPFVLEIVPGGQPIPKPKKYDHFNRNGKFTLQDFGMFKDQKPGRNYPFWSYRRLISKNLFPEYSSDVSMINWESNDLRGENIIDVDAQTQTQHLADGKLISLCFLHWLQTEAPHDEGNGKGYPQLQLRNDMLGTADGVSKYPYIRESRRLKAIKIVKEQEIAAATNPGVRAQLFPDSIGIGLYPIDIHGHQDVPGAGQESKPFQIPLGAMVQTKIRNFLPACKNIGTTHVTNGAYRLHPIEWAIGEAAGLVAALCLEQRARPETVWRNKRKLRTIQQELVELGSPIFWFDDVPTDDPEFATIQMAAVTGTIPISDETLHYRTGRGL